MNNSILIREAKNEMAEIKEEAKAKGSYCEFCIRKDVCDAIFAKHGVSTEAHYQHYGHELYKQCSIERWAYEKHFKALGYNPEDVQDEQGRGLIAENPIVDDRGKYTCPN